MVRSVRDEIQHCSWNGLANLSARIRLAEPRIGRKRYLSTASESFSYTPLILPGEWPGLPMLIESQVVSIVGLSRSAGNTSRCCPVFSTCRPPGESLNTTASVPDSGTSLYRRSFDGPSASDYVGNCRAGYACEIATSRVVAKTTSCTNTFEGTSCATGAARVLLRAAKLYHVPSCLTSTPRV
jgi:hypothetical protein